MDIYSADAKIARYKLRVLEDDLACFPRYAALLLYRLDLPARFPVAWAAIGRLEGRIGSIPAAVLALLTQALFEAAEYLQRARRA